MTVPFLDVGAGTRELRADLDAAIARVVEGGRYLLGEETASFEREFAQYVGVKHCVGVANGLDALRIGLRALGIGPGDEVIVPAHTFIATWLAVSDVGATPVPVEPDLETFNVDPARVAEACGPRTRAIVPVHLYGQPADLDPLLALARERGISILEDCAQAHGARYRGKRVGAFGALSAWSFYPAKNLGCFGDGGAITTDDDRVADQARLLGNYGSRAKYRHETRGLNSRLSELNAAVLRVKLRVLDDWNERRRRLARRYETELAGTELTLPAVRSWAEPVWHLYVIRSKKRDQLQAALRNRGVETLIHYPTPPHLQPAYQDLRRPEGSFPISERIDREVLSLPMGPHLNEQQREYVVSSAREALA